MIMPVTSSKDLSSQIVYSMKFSPKIVRNPLRRPSLLFLLSGVLAASLLFLRIEANREEEVFSDLKTAVDAAAGRNALPEAVVTEAMHLTHAIVGNRIRVSGGVLFEGWPLRSCTGELVNPGGSHSYSRVLARLLECYHYPVRICKLEAGGHFITEVQIDGRWVALDPMDDVVFGRATDIHYSYRARPVLQVYTFYFYVVLVGFVLLIGYIYFGMRGLLPWQKAVDEACSLPGRSMRRPVRLRVYLN